jgi:protocatechuate 3,4-dioxygenase beta subunit
MTCVRPARMQVTASAALLAVALGATTAGAAVQGWVVSSAGGPLAGVTVSGFGQESSVDRTSRLAAGRARVPLSSAVTAADGSFQLAAVPAVVHLQAGREGFAPAFATVADGERVTLALRQAHTVRGIVTSHGSPVVGAAITWSPDGLQDVVVHSGKDGSYEILDPDAWAQSLEIIHPDFALLAWTREASWPRMEMEPANRHLPAPLHHELEPGVEIEGKVVDEKGARGVGGAVVFVDGRPLGRSGPDGTFRVRHAKAGWTRLTAEAQGLVGVGEPSGRGLVRMTTARRLTGVVRDSGSGRPLPGATVGLHSEGPGAPLLAITNASGRYAFDGLAPAQYSLSLGRVGYAATDLAEASAHTVDLRSAMARERDRRLSRVQQVAGRVRDEQQRPVAGALVSLAVKDSPRIYAQGTEPEAWLPSTRTAPDGTFAVNMPGQAPAQLEFTLVAIKPGYAMGVRESLRLPAATPAVVILPSGVPISGRVTAPNGAPIPEVAVELMEGASKAERSLLLLDTEGDGWTRTDALGRFATRVRSVPHALAFHRHGVTPKAVALRDPSAGEELVVVLEPAVEIRGTVLRYDGSPANDVQVLARRKGGGTLAGASTGGDGGFVINELAPGSYELRVIKNDADLGVSQAVEAPADGLRLTLEQVGMLKGLVLDAKTRQPLSQFDVYADGGAAASEGQRFHRGRIADAATGGFEIGDLPIGEVALDVRAPGFLAKHIGGLSVTSDPATPEVEVALEPGVVIRGRVTSDDGAPVAEAKVGTVMPEAGWPSTETDERGEYELPGVPPGSVELVFRKEGLLTVRKTVNTTDTTRVDVLLSRGLVLHGVVLSEGAGVAKAQVSTSSSVVGTEDAKAQTEADGRFTVEGLAPGRYSVTARGPDGGKAEMEDVDVEKTGVLRLSLHHPPTAVLSGRVVGLSVPDFDAITIEAEGEAGSESTNADPTGAFRMERAPAGQVHVSASASLDDSSRASRVNELVLEPGSEAQTVLKFSEGVTITGRVTREGEPVAEARVSFRHVGTPGAGAAAATDADGRYAVVGLEAGPHEVDVTGEETFFKTRYEVAGDAQLDFDTTEVKLNGRAVDAATGAPLVGAAISLWPVGAGESSPAASASASVGGEFSFHTSADGRYRLLASANGYGHAAHELDLQRGENAPILLELQPSEGLSIAVVDARDERPLNAIVVVRDATRRIVVNEHSGVGADGTVTVPLAPGQYLLSTSATGYGTATLMVSAPGRGLKVRLTPGGTLVVDSERDLRGTLRLVGPDGEEYVRCWCSGISSIDLKGRHTTIPNITPASYSVQALDAAGRPLAAPSSVTISEGQRSSIRIE